MNHLALTHLKELLFSKTPLLGAGQRLKAAKALAAAPGPVAAAALAEGLSGLDDEAVHQVARDRLSQLQEQDSIDAVCQVWAAGRHPRLAALVAENAWLPEGPPRERVLCALLQQNPALLAADGADVIVPLIAATSDADPALATAAWEALHQLTDDDAKEALCELVYAQGNAVAARAVREAHYMPRNPADRGLFLFLSEQWDLYASLDPEGHLLFSGWLEADPELRTTMAQIASEGCRIEWGRAVLRQPKDLSETEWEALLVVLAEHREYDAIWQMAKHQIPARSVPLLLLLVEAGWAVPESSPADRALFEKLSNLARRCKGDPAEFESRRTSKTLFEGKAGQVGRLALSPDWRYLACGGDDTEVRLFALPDGTPLAPLTGLNGWLSCLAFSPNGRFLAVGSMKHQTRIYHLPDGRLCATLDTRDVSCAAITRDGKLLAVNAGSRIDLWGLPEGKLIRSFRGDDRMIAGLVIGPRGHYLASYGSDNAVHIWSLPDGKAVATLDAHTNRPTAVAFSPDEQVVATATLDNDLRTWMLPSGQALACQQGLPSVIKSLAIDPAGTLLASGAHDNTVRLHRLPDGEVIETLADYHGGAGSVQLNVMGQALTACSEGKKSVKIYFPPFPRFDADLETIRPEEVAWAQRQHKDATLTREERAWLAFWGTQVLAIIEGQES